MESQLSFDIPGLKTKGELLIVVIVSAGARSGLYYASIPDTTPELVQPARDALAALVGGPISAAGWAAGDASPGERDVSCRHPRGALAV